MMTTTNAIVKEIHNHASTAEERLLVEAKRLLRQTDDLGNTGRLSQLKNLGFTAFKEVKALDPQERAKAKELMDLIDTYRVKAPSYHFMTEEAVTELCVKYNLVQGPVSAYTDSIPTVNQEHIINFKIDESLLDYTSQLTNDLTSVWMTQNGKVDVRSMTLQHTKNLLRFFDRELKNRGMSIFDDRKRAPKLVTDVITRGCVQMGNTPMEFLRVVFSHNTQVVSESSGGIDVFDFDDYVEPHHFIASCADIAQRNMSAKTTPYFRIIAAPEMFNTDGLTLTEDRRLVLTPDEAVAFKPEPARIPDPIVQVKVKGGWLNVTAWGEEAELDETFDYSQN